MLSHAKTEQDQAAEITPTIAPKTPWRIAEVRPLPGFKLWVRFNDGVSGTVSLGPLIHSAHSGVFSALCDESLFSQVRLEYGAVTWPGELDLAPDTMYEAIRRNGEYLPD